MSLTFDVPVVAVPFAPLAIPVKFVTFDVYVINSVTTAIVPPVGKPVLMLK